MTGLSPASFKIIFALPHSKATWITNWGESEASLESPLLCYILKHTDNKRGAGLDSSSARRRIRFWTVTEVVDINLD